MKNYKNNSYVMVKTTHHCKYCKELIPIGSEVRTINPRFEDRYWVCNECDSLLKKIIDAKQKRECTAFGDEGGYLANDNYLHKVVCDFLDRCKDDKVAKDIEDYIE